MRRSLLVGLLIAAFMIGAIGSAQASQTWYNLFSSTYPNSSTLTNFSCQTCHVPAGPPARNPYGSAFANAGHSLTAIESQDSDGDGATNIAEINAGTNPGDPTSTPAPAPLACTDYTYSAWSACDASGQQTRTVTGNLPSGCTGNPSSQPVLTQSCTPPASPVACADYTYSAWSACDASGQQTRRVTGNLPSGCTGNPSVQPVLTQTCNYVPPTPSAPTVGTIPVPTVGQVFSYQPADLPVVSDDPAQAKPVGVGPLATGGDTIDVRVDIGPFSGPVNVSLLAYAPAVDWGDLYFIAPGFGLKKLSDAVGEEEQAELNGQVSSRESEGGELSLPARHFRDLVIWKKNVTAVNEEVFTAKITDLPSGLYPLVLVVTSVDNPDNSYRWITYMFIP